MGWMRNSMGDASEHFPKPKNQATNRFDAEENKQIRKTIAECVDHHRLIVSFADDVSDFYGPMLALNYMYHLISCCLLLLECSQKEPDALARYGPLTVIIFGQLISVSVVFEIVETKSEKLRDAVYEMPWESMDLSNQRSVCIFLRRSQTSIQVTAMGMTSVGVQTMVNIMKTSFSYFAFLQSRNE
ncbi:unnamed protein product [Chilo suppressalis]|uniref:Odorant receptor n=1 Tax=Chilo suppressalis TaxID=168631 RepID=A0ABN8BFA4_CHISP|nr:hypothetical protein evm_002367 [Chilo suppressalis]CAH0406461.1 unnamed protein product [Chilo suppressalis]